MKKLNFFKSLLLLSILLTSNSYGFSFYKEGEKTSRWLGECTLGFKPVIHFELFRKLTDYESGWATIELQAYVGDSCDGAMAYSAKIKFKYESILNSPNDYDYLTKPFRKKVSVVKMSDFNENAPTLLLLNTINPCIYNELVNNDEVDLSSCNVKGFRQDNIDFWKVAGWRFVKHDESTFSLRIDRFLPDVKFAKEQ